MFKLFFFCHVFFSFQRQWTMRSVSGIWLVKNLQDPPRDLPLSQSPGSDWSKLTSVTVTMDFGFARIQEVRTWVWADSQRGAQNSQLRSAFCENSSQVWASGGRCSAGELSLEVLQKNGAEEEFKKSLKKRWAVFYLSVSSELGPSFRTPLSAVHFELISW